MATQAQLEANRQNAQKSTGPKTAEGKAQSSKNALTHGLTATGESLLPHEAANSYYRFHQEMSDSLHPGSPLENMLVRRITDTLWRLQRVPDAEAQLFTALAEKARNKVQKENDEEQEGYEKELRWKDPKDVAPLDIRPLPEDPSAAQALAKAFLKKDSQNPFMRLQRYEQALNRTLNKSLHELRQLQHQRQQDPRDEYGLPLQIKVDDLQHRLGELIDQNLALKRQLEKLQQPQQTGVQIKANSPLTAAPTAPCNTPPAQLATQHSLLSTSPIPTLNPKPQPLNPPPTLQLQIKAKSSATPAPTAPCNTPPARTPAPFAQLSTQHSPLSTPSASPYGNRPIPRRNA